MAALDNTVYSGKQYEVYLSLQSDALGTNDVSGTLYKLRVPEVNDIEWSEGFQTADVERTGQRVLRPTDHIKTYKGGTFTWSFDNLIVIMRPLEQFKSKFEVFLVCAVLTCFVVVTTVNC